jgi:UDP-2-acetamido-2,6-beta-L-arabino-hexul-4-ose reductase
MRVLVTGAYGFIGKNLMVRLSELRDFEATAFGRDDSINQLESAVAHVDAVVHLAGVNRPDDASAFEAVNAGLTVRICEAIGRSARSIPLLLASSIQAEQDNRYGRSKRAGEQAVEAHAASSDSPVRIYRLPNVFGKWCRPNYNSVVATFCHNIANGLPIRIDNHEKELRLVYVDDVVEEIVRWLREPAPGLSRGEVVPEYGITLGALADQIEAFVESRDSLVSERVGTGLTRALYATYLSYLPPERFVYEVPAHGDARGVFVEMLKTPDCGQFSYFTAHPGITRGGHYHHTKTEKFLVLKGEALFRFRHLVSGQAAEVRTQGGKPVVVETIPGWTHDITNVGADEMIVMLWANEIFDRQRPDTVAMAL